MTDSWNWRTQVGDFAKNAVSQGATAGGISDGPADVMGDFVGGDYAPSLRAPSDISLPASTADQTTG